jgi:RNA polymerase sigma factor (sigma-70 family)
MTLLSTDRTLLEQFRQGRAEALSRVHEEYAPMIAAFLARGFTFSSKGRSLQFRGYQQPFDLENALQETFLRAFSEGARASYDGLTPYRSYLTAISRNLVISELRRREVAMSALCREVEGSSLEDAASDLPLSGTPEPTGEAELLQKELSGLYQRFVDGLEPVQRGFFVARFEEQRTQVEAGKLNGLSHMQARTLEKKLRTGLLRFLQAQGYLEGAVA